MKRVVFTIVCGCCMLLGSMIRSGPVYGKLDFILLESKNWWHEMRPMFEEVLAAGNQPVYSDKMTQHIFKMCFGQKTKYPRGSDISKMEHENSPYIEDINKKAGESLDEKESKDDPQRPYRCVVNLKGFTPTWVPVETRHWHATSAQTWRYYYLPAETEGEKITGRQNLIDALRKNPLKNCVVYQ